MLGHLSKEPRGFSPQGYGGGSKRGKPQSTWPWIFKVGGHALAVRWKGSEEAWNADRTMPPIYMFKCWMDETMPGWEKVAEKYQPGRSTSLARLLRNRVYKMHYNGTSARGKNHDPYTRGTISKEHWRNHIPVGHPLWRLHEDIVRGKVVVIKDWKKYLP